MKTLEVNLNKLLGDLETKVGKKVMAKLIQGIMTDNKVEPIKKKELKYQEEFHYITTCRFCGTTVNRITTYHSDNKEKKKEFIFIVNRCESCNELLDQLPVTVLREIILALIDNDFHLAMRLAASYQPI
mgnify:FL=1